jgi:hypothetical protein
MSSYKHSFELIEQAEGLTATTLQQQVQDAQEAYFDLERELENAVSIVQEAVELYEDGEELGSIIARMKQFLEEQQI